MILWRFWIPFKFGQKKLWKSWALSKYTYYGKVLLYTAIVCYSLLDAHPFPTYKFTCSIVEAFEEIVTVLVEQENFTSLTSVGEDLIFTAERVGKLKV